MKKFILGLTAVVLLPVVPANAAAGDVAAGREKARICAGCHGANGISVSPGIPSLAGQRDQFTQWQLVFFRSGRRPNLLMGPIVAQLSDADIRDLGAYYASLPANAQPAGGKPDEALLAKGQAIVAEHHCANCHTETFRGERAAPSIADQREDYLAKALADYRSAARPSVGVAAMTEAAAGLNDDEIAAIAKYLATYQAPVKATEK
jgi:cytochrome c553